LAVGSGAPAASFRAFLHPGFSIGEREAGGVLYQREGEDQATHQGNGQQSDHPKPGPTHAIAMQ
jgi:hypothetical protein